MSKKYEARKIKTKRSYTFKEIADLLGLHIRTIQSWHTDGMLTLEGSNNPYLVMGIDVQNYIKQQKLKHKVNLKSNEFYCVSCRQAVIPAKVYKYIGNIMMGGHKHSIRLNGQCPNCNHIVNKFTTETQPILDDSNKIIGVLDYPRED